MQIYYYVACVAIVAIELQPKIRQNVAFSSFFVYEVTPEGVKGVI